MTKQSNSQKWYVYLLKDETGKKMFGVCQGTSISNIKQKLREYPYFFISAQPTDIQKIFKTKVDLHQSLVFTRRLSSLIDSGIPIVSVMNILWRQTEDRNMQLIISHISKNIENGSTIASAMDYFPYLFSPMYRSLIRVSETSGGLVYILKRLVAYLDGQKALITKIKKATFYPALVTVFAFLVLIGMFTFVVPTFQKVLLRLNVDLPVLTKMIISISQFMRSWVFLLTVFILGAGIWGACIYIKRRKSLVYRLDSLKLKLPIFGEILYITALSRFVNSLSVLLASGLPLVQSLELAKATTANQRFVHLISRVQKEVEQGQSIYKSFKGMGVFPVLMVEMLGVGESSGSIVESLENLTKHFDEEVDYRLNQVLTLIEPLLILFVGVIVVVTMLAIYLPIFSVWQGLSK